MVLILRKQWKLIDIYYLFFLQNIISRGVMNSLLLTSLKPTLHFPGTRKTRVDHVFFFFYHQLLFPPQCPWVFLSSPFENVLTEHYVLSVLCTAVPSCMTMFFLHCFLFFFPSTLQQLPLTNVLKITSRLTYMEALGT